MSRPFTVDDLDRMPDDGRRYELVDGVLFVSPAPAVQHQLVLGERPFRVDVMPSQLVAGLLPD